MTLNLDIALNDSSHEPAFDVIIVGGGMVGASLACALAETELKIAVLDSQDFRCPEPLAEDGAFDPRVSAITSASREFFIDLGVWDAIVEQRSCAYTDMRVWDADGTGSIHFAASDIHVDELGHIVENSIILAALHSRLRACNNVELIAQASVTALEGHIVGATPQMTTRCSRVGLADGRSLYAHLLVAADGVHSKVRELAGFKTREWDYEHRAIVTTVRTELPHDRTAIQRFMDAGTLAFLPLSTGADGRLDDQQYCSIVWSVLPEYADHLMALDDERFARELTGAIEGRLGKIESTEIRHSFPLRQRHATRYVQSGIALIGDAAHTIHPLAGQGVNLGLLDAQILAREIKQALATGRDIADLQVLRRYQRRRIGHNLGMMWTMEGFKRLFADQPLPLRWLRNIGMTGIDRTTMLKNRIMRSAMGID